MRFLDLGPGDAVPDANTIWTFREALTKAGATERLFDQALREAGYLTMFGQLVDASIVSAPKQRNTRIGLANLVHNIRRLLWLERQSAHLT